MRCFSDYLSGLFLCVYSSVRNSRSLSLIFFVSLIWPMSFMSLILLMTGGWLGTLFGLTSEMVSLRPGLRGETELLHDAIDSSKSW